MGGKERLLQDAGPAVQSPGMPAAPPEILAIYADLAARPIERGCDMRTECCQFRLTGRTPMLTKGEAVPDDGYHGEYVADIAKVVPADVAARAEAEPERAGWIIGEWASENIRSGIEASLERLGDALLDPALTVERALAPQ